MVTSQRYPKRGPSVLFMGMNRRRLVVKDNWTMRQVKVVKWHKTINANNDIYASDDNVVYADFGRKAPAVQELAIAA